MITKFYRMDLPVYRELVASLPSCLSGESPCVPHHLKGTGHLGGGSLKAPDQFCMPVTDEQHKSYHDGNMPWFKEEQWEHVARTQAWFIGELCRALGNKEMGNLVRMVRDLGER